MDKARLLDSALARRKWQDAAASVEFGAFVGYTTLRLGSKATHGQGHLSVSLEVDYIHQVMARCLVRLACLSFRAEVWSGQVRDTVPRVMDEMGMGAVPFVFMDHRGTRFHQDLARLVSTDALAATSLVVADNVLNPGSPVYAWNIHELAHIVAWFLLEFMSSNREDWMLVTDTLLGPPH